MYILYIYIYILYIYIYITRSETEMEVRIALLKARFSSVQVDFSLAKAMLSFASQRLSLVRPRRP